MGLVVYLFPSRFRLRMNLKGSLSKYMIITQSKNRYRDNGCLTLSVDTQNYDNLTKQIFVGRVRQLMQSASCSQ